MKASPYYFEIKDMVAQFISAFDDIVIGRYNRVREEVDKINVRYLNAPKERVMHDIINQNKTITLPAVACHVTGITRDTERVFNKLDGFYYSGMSGNDRVSKHVKSPVPVNVNLSVSIIARYQTDLDQILSNFIPFTNPYVIISWYVPKEFDIPTDQEIRSQVLWDGSVSITHPIELRASEKARSIADTSFTIKGWLFKDEADPVGNIHYIRQNFNAADVITEYDAMEAQDLTTETQEYSGSPSITDMFYNGVRLFDDITLSAGDTGNVQLYGNSFNHTQGVLLSTDNNTIYTELTSIPATTRQSEISGQLIPFNVLNDNVIDIPLPTLSAGNIRLVPFNIAGYSFSDNSLHTQTFSANSTFITVE